VRGSSGVLAAGAVLLTLTASRPASAEVALGTSLSARKVAVGDRFTLRLRVTSSDNDPIQDPQLKLPSGISASGPSMGQQSSINIVNGQMTQSLIISATWVLVASRPGTFKLGPASVATTGGRKSDQPVTIEVVPEGSLPPPPLGGQPLDPFDLLRGMGGPGFPGMPGFPGFPEEPQPEEEQLPPVPEEYRVDRALDPIAFVRSRAVPRKVVVGEQVTLSSYAYAGRGSFQLGGVTEPSRNDFLTFNVMEGNDSLRLLPIKLDNTVWGVVKVSEFALFPLKVGKLKAGEVSVTFVGGSYSKDPRGLKRASLPVEIDVVEPPLDGRPPGYRLGDVGHFSLSAQVQPRQVEAGGSISVVAKLEGTGYLPSTLLVPEQDGAHFLEPQTIDQVAPEHGVVQGFRTFTYVVELPQPGERDLGEITLPYWDPKAHAYDVARAALGKVNVTGTAKPRAPNGKAGDSGPHLKGLITPPPKLGAIGVSRPSYWPSRVGYWLLLFGVPLTAALGFALSDLAKLLSRRLREQRGSLAAALDDALAQLANRASAGDAPGSAGAAERALFVAIEKATGLKARGVLKAELGSALSKVAVSANVAEQTAALLARCDQLRFAGEAVELASFAAEVREVCQKLSAQKPRAAGASS
jgi:hypothetical protein